MAMRLVWFLVLLSSSIPAFGWQTQRKPTLTFAVGAVLLANGDTVHGSVDVYSGIEMLLVGRPNQPPVAYTAEQVTRFAVHNLPAIRDDQQSQSSVKTTFPPAPQYQSLANGHLTMTPNARRKYDDRIQRLYQRQPEVAVLEPDKIRIFGSFLWSHVGSKGNTPRRAFFEQLTNGPYQLLRRQRLVTKLVPADQHDLDLGMQLVDTYFLALADEPVQLLAQPRRDLLRIAGKQAAAIKAYASQYQLQFDNPSHLAHLVTYLNSFVGSSAN